jgi:hypothetical protein
MADFIGFPYLDETPFCLGVPVWGSQILYKPWRLAFRKHVEHWKAGRKCVWKRPSCKMCRYIRYLFINGRYFNWQFLWGKPVNDNGFMIFMSPTNGHERPVSAGECLVGLGEAIRLRPKPRAQNDGFHHVKMSKKKA